MNVNVIASGTALALIALMSVAAVHKVSVLRARRAAYEPLMQSSTWRKSHASLLLTLALLAELAAISLLIFAVPVGLMFSAALLVFYVLELNRLSPSESCNCFGSVSKATISDAQTRNILLGIVCLLVAAIAFTKTVSLLVTSGSIGVAFVVMAAIAGFETLARLPGGRTTASRH